MSWSLNQKWNKFLRFGLQCQYTEVEKVISQAGAGLTVRTFTKTFFFLEVFNSCHNSLLTDLLCRLLKSFNKYLLQWMKFDFCSKNVGV